MPEEIYLPHQIGDLYRNKDTGLEVVLIYDKGWMYDTRPESSKMIPSVTYMDDDFELVAYPKEFWEEMYEPVPTHVTLIEEHEDSEA